ncbi:uncharacterized protein DMAD_05848 [Drosophila madeirensis]|uniref:Uncharacterized protein n=1 Tax=Drosophila madeirensis TaxID=30013 RepID=A0AAU9FP14_DROMD
MQVESSKLELRQICVEICAMAGTWYHYIKIGRETMSHFSGVRLHILDLENRLTNISNERLLRAADREIRTKYDRLSYPIAAMKTYLEQLRKVRDRICTFLSRTRMFMDDEIVEKYDITPILSTPQVLEILEFLRSRYDAEWEVKEMVVMSLEDVNSAYEIEVLVKAWGDCRHANGEEFVQKLSAFWIAVLDGILPEPNPIHILTQESI